MTGTLSSQTALGYPASTIAPWAGETPDKVLATGASEYSVADARAIVKRFAEVTTSLDIDTFAQGFTTDCVTSFNEFAEMKGRDALRQFMGARFRHLRAAGSGFVCRKVLRALTGNIFGVIWLNEWIESRKPMRSKGVEFWVMKDGQIARWDCSTTMWSV